MFDGMTQEFRGDFEKWRASRPQWRRLLAAVKNGASTRAEGDALREVAADAGADAQELADLQHIVKHAKAHAAEAARYPAAAKELARLDHQVEQCRAGVKGASASEHGAAVHRLRDAKERRDLFWRGAYIGAEQAHRYLKEIAEPAGLV